MQKKIIIAILLTVVIISGSLGVISYIAVRESIDNTLQHKLELSKIVARNIDLLLSSSLKRLYDISLSGTIDLSDGNWSPERDALKKAYDYSIFSDGLFILDRTGNVVFNYPYQPLNYVNLLSRPNVSTTITEGKPFVSDIFTIEPARKKMIYILVPLKNRHGIVEGAVGAEIDPATQNFREIIRSLPSEKNAFMELVDSHGVVIASSDPKRMFKDQSEGHSQFLIKLIAEKKAVITKCHRCHEATADQTSTRSRRSNDIMTYAPLELAPWGVSIIQPERDILSPIATMKRSFLMVSLVFICLALIIAIGMSRAIVKPVHELIDATVKIADGDMSKAIAFGGMDEIGKLSSSFEVMRLKLADSMEELHRHTIELVQKVTERTRQINDSRQKIKELLKKVITSQEEERKRIAREFHDVLMQDLAATLIKIDLCKKYPQNISEKQINEVKQIIEKSIDEVYSIIKNLRPSVLDDLGFEAAVRWLLDHHLESKGIKCYINIYNTINNLEFEPQIEIELFRIIQEAIMNISKHAEAHNVFALLEIRENDLIIEIEDDGCGFDPDADFLSDMSSRGLGLLGMKERAGFLNWDLKIRSTPQQGTRVHLRVPLNSEVVTYA
ncbi:MAG: cache domain-containing protein [Thermodesulfovibrionales bacterium]